MVGRTLELTLPGDLADMIDDAVSEGRYVDGADFVRDMLRRERDVLHHRRALATALQAGLDSGPSEPLDMDAFIRERRTRHHGG